MDTKQRKEIKNWLVALSHGTQDCQSLGGKIKLFVEYNFSWK